jgi:hypothetical protein
VIEAEKATYTVKQMCDLLEVSRLFVPRCHHESPSC